LQGKSDDQFIIIGGTLSYVHAGRHAIQLYRAQVLTDFTVSTLLEFADSYLARNKGEDAQVFLFILLNFHVIVRHKQRLYFLFLLVLWLVVLREERFFCFLVILAS